MVTHVHPSRPWFTCRIRPVLMVQVTRFYVRNPTRTIQVPRAPLHAQGVTSDVAISRTASAGVTPLSSLIRAHAPDQRAPIDFGRPYFDRSLQLVVTHCCASALADVLSANLSLVAWTHTPAVPLVHSLVSSQKTSAFTNRRVARHLTNPRTATSARRGISGLQSFSYVQASRFARHPGCTDRRTPFGPLGSRGFYFHAYLGSLPPRVVDMLAVRIEQLTAWGLSPH